MGVSVVLCCLFFTCLCCCCVLLCFCVLLVVVVVFDVVVRVVFVVCCCGCGSCWWCSCWFGPPSAGLPSARPPPRDPPQADPLRWTAQNFALFSLSRSHFRSLSLSLCVFSLNFGGFCEDRDPQMCTFGISGCRARRGMMKNTLFICGGRFRGVSLQIYIYIYISIVHWMNLIFAMRLHRDP